MTGELGGGKTQFVKGLAEGLGIAEPVSSPTFTYEKVYQSPQGLQLHHYDLYRSDSLDEDIAELLQESFGSEAVVAVEWAERAKNVWPEKFTILNFDWVGENERKIDIKNG